jgi:hypothetical protein
MTPDALDVVLNDYYRSGTPAQAVEALRHLSQQPESHAPERLASLATFFAAVGRRTPEAASGYRALHDAGPSGRALLDAVLRAMDRPIRRAPVTSAVDLDVRWSEFLATGEVQPVQEIIAVLSWEDRLRARIEAWLGERRALDFVLGPARRRAKLAEKLRPLGVTLDDDHLVVRSAVDLDCDTILRGVTVAPDKVKLLQQTLPSPLGQPELLYMATKTAALWSLASNAGRHPLVLDACVAAHRSVVGPSRLSLLAVLCEAHLARGDAREALASADAALALEPGHADFLAWRGVAQQRVARDDAMALFDRDEGVRPMAPADTASLRTQCLARLPAAYGVHAEIRAAGRPGNPSRGGLTSEWDAVFQRNRSRGERWFWDAESGQGLADRWVTLPGEHYEFPGLWVRLADAMRAGEMQALQVETCAALLAQPPDAAERVARGGVEYQTLRYDNARLPRLLPLLGGDDAPCTVHLWLREGDAALRAVRVRRGDDGPAGDELQQVILDASGEPRIEAPAEAIDARKGTRVVGDG